MKHFILLILFAAAVATVFGAVGRNDARARFNYGAKVFAEFVGIGLVLAWIMYLSVGR